MPEPTAPRVRFGLATAAELLVTLAAVADPTWQDAFAAAPAESRRAVSALGRGFVRRVERVGRFGFLNLLGVVGEIREPWTAASIVSWVRRTPAADVHLTLLGARRKQLRDLVPDHTLLAAVGGATAARRALRAAFASDRIVIGTTRWLLGTPSAEVKAEVLALLDTWRTERLPARAERALREELTRELVLRRATLLHRPAREVVTAVAGGLSYDPPGARSLLLLAAPSVRPIVVVVDDLAGHVIAYPPAAPEDPRQRLVEMARALGDDTRLRILEALGDGPLTAAALATAVGAPRTSLLHHLALLRAAGLLTTSVGRNNATYYEFRPTSLRELHNLGVAVLL